MIQYGACRDDRKDSKVVDVHDHLISQAHIDLFRETSSSWAVFFQRSAQSLLACYNLLKV